MMEAMEDIGDIDIDELLSDIDDMNAAPSAMDDLYLEIDEANGVNDTAVRLSMHNGMTSDMKLIEAVIHIESINLNRHVLINVAWETANPKEPSSINIQYEIGANQELKLLIKDALNEFSKKTSSSDYCKRDFDMGLARYKGMQALEGDSGLGAAVYAALGRNAEAIVDFLAGGEKYKKIDLTYENKWGAW